MTTPNKQPGRPRDEHKRLEILETTLAQLDRGPYEGVAIETVSAEVSCGKATIYRWWKSRAGLVADAITSSGFEISDGWRELFLRLANLAPATPEISHNLRLAKVLSAALYEPELARVFWGGRGAMKVDTAARLVSLEGGDFAYEMVEARPVDVLAELRAMRENATEATDLLALDEAIQVYEKAEKKEQRTNASELA